MLQETLKVIGCKRCGHSIVYIRTAAGKFMPCDATPVRIIESASGEHKALRRETGKLVSCIFVKPDCEVADGWGYIPHFGTCAAEMNTRRPQKKPAPPVRKAEVKKETKKAQAEPSFEQLSLFPSLERRSIHPF